MRLVISLAALSLAAAAAAAAPLAAQSAAEHIALGDSAHPMLHPDHALPHYRAALALDSTNYEATWKAGLALIDIAKQIESNADSTKKRRDTLYLEARALGERAVRLRPNRAEGHFVIGAALGRLSRTRGGKERVRFARIIYDEGMKAIALDSTYDNAYHLIGAWHAEVRRLSGLTRFFAKTLFGAGFMDRASWDDAVRYLERAVALNPQHVYHRLELAEVYVDLKRYTKAREQLTTIATLPDRDVLDHQYQRDAVELLAEIKDKKDKS